MRQRRGQDLCIFFVHQVIQHKLVTFFFGLLRTWSFLPKFAYASKILQHQKGHLIYEKDENYVTLYIYNGLKMNNTNTKYTIVQ